MPLNSITSTASKACFLWLMFVVTLFFILRYSYVLEANISSREPLQLGDPPSVILAPPRGFCDNHHYLIIVITRAEEQEARRQFMATYGRFSKRYNFVILFPVGLSNDEKVNIALRKEHENHSNILQTNFIDSYRNLTLKSYSYANYVRKNCTNVKAILKVDDDISWNVEKVLNFLEEIDPRENVLYCQTVLKPWVERQENKRWYVSREVYPHEFFPEYCLSPFYAGTPVTFASLYSATSAVNHVWLDDVFSAGIVAQKAGVTFRYLPINYERGTYEPFLNGRVIAQYLKRKEDGVTLFVAANINATKILQVKDLF